jgi:hypothetical protein
VSPSDRTNEPVAGYDSPIGPAWFLAQAVNRKLKGYGIKHAGRATERTIRFYATRKLIDKPVKAEHFDGRQAVFCQIQMYQACVLLALGPRGYKLDSIRRAFKSADIARMDDMLRLVATTEVSLDEAFVGRNDIVR